MKARFYRCNLCDQLVLVLDKRVSPLICCGSEMEYLTSRNDDQVKEKHVPSYVRNGNEVTVSVGSTLHPSSKEHYIDWVAILTNKGYQVKYISRNELPITKFFLDKDEELLSIYSYCNLHSLYEKKIKEL